MIHEHIDYTLFEKFLNIYRGLYFSQLKFIKKPTQKLKGRNLEILIEISKTPEEIKSLNLRETYQELPNIQINSKRNENNFN